MRRERGGIEIVNWQCTSCKFTKRHRTVIWGFVRGRRKLDVLDYDWETPDDVELPCDEGRRQPPDKRRDKNKLWKYLCSQPRIRNREWMKIATPPGFQTMMVLTLLFQKSYTFDIQKHSVKIVPKCKIKSRLPFPGCILPIFSGGQAQFSAYSSSTNFSHLSAYSSSYSCKIYRPSSIIQTFIEIFTDIKENQKSVDYWDSFNLT